MAEREFPASVGQRLLWFLERRRQNQAVLNCPVLCRLHGRLDTEALTFALTALIARHESLRTTFVIHDRALHQVVHDPEPPEMKIVDLSEQPDAEQAADVAVAAEMNTAIDRRSRPLRITLWRLGPATHILCINSNHMVCDAWSGGLIVRDLVALLAQWPNRAADLPPIEWQYAAFTQWQYDFLAGRQGQAARDYWQRQLEGASIPELSLVSAGAVSPYVPASVGSALGILTVKALREVARAHRTTLFVALLAVFFGLMLSRTGRGDLAVASLFANRQRPEIRNTVGFFANMILLRARVKPSASFIETLCAIHADVMDAFVHQVLPIHLLSANVLARDSARPGSLVVQLMPGSMEPIRAGELLIEPLVPERMNSRFDLELSFVERAGDIRIVLFFDAAKFETAWVEGMLADFATLARGAAARPRSPLVGLLEPIGAVLG